MNDRNPELSKNFQTAIAVHEGLKVYGISYMLSPNRPFAKAVVDPEIVDSLKYPRQTLGYRAGDCADLSVLYASCFEAAGIQTAFVTIPGHIFMAVDLGLTVDQAVARSMDLREFIVHDNRVWLPVETTMRDAGFIEVWHKAASEWRDASASNAAAFYPVHEAWDLYAPIGLPADGSTIVPPSKSETSRLFREELAKAVNSELGLRLAALGPLVTKGPDADKSLNNRGVLYGKYGQFPEAIQYFEQAAGIGSTSALVNLGNIAILKSDPATAYTYFKQAAKQLPGNPKLLVNLAKAASLLGKNDEAAKALTDVKKIDPHLAEQYAWVAQPGATGARAAAVNEADVLWF
jgi:tetratricopeptide (TPR) repeat protein